MAISFEKSEIACRPGGSAEADTSFAMTILQIGRWKHTDPFSLKDNRVIIAQYVYQKMV